MDKIGTGFVIKAQRLADKEVELLKKKYGNDLICIDAELINKKKDNVKYISNIQDCFELNIEDHLQEQHKI